MANSIPALSEDATERRQAQLERWQSELRALVPELAAVEDIQPKPVIRFFEGKEGYMAIREEMLKVKSKEFFVIYSFDALASLFSYEERVAYSTKRAKKKIKAKLIYTSEKGKFTDEPHPDTERCFVAKEKIPLSTDIIIYDHNVVLLSLQEAPIGMVVTHPSVSESMRSIFNTLWLQGDREVT